MILRTVIADDEPLAVERMSALLERIADVEIVGAANSGREVIEIVSKGGCDLVLLDIQMPNLDGFDATDILAKLPSPAPSIVFVTAHDIRAVEAFDVGVTDFLTKPVRLNRLEAAITRVRRHRANAAAADHLLQLGVQLPGLRTAIAEDAADHLWINRRGETVKINLSDIVRLQAEGEYVRIFLEGRDHLHRAALSAIYERLIKRGYIRIHRASVIRRSDITSVRRSAVGGYSVSLRDGLTLPVGRTYRADLRAMLVEGTAASR